MVTNLVNGRSIEVTINDRGPFVQERVIDLSYAAAHALGMIGPGTIPVRIEVIDSPKKILRIRDRLDYTLQLGSFTEVKNAQTLKEEVGRFYPEVSVVPFQGKDAVYYRVQLGTYSSRGEAERYARELVRRGFSTIIMEK